VSGETQFFVLCCESSRSSSGDGTPQNNLQHTSLLVTEIGQTSTKNFVLYRAASAVDFLDCEREPLGKPASRDRSFAETD